MEPRRSAIIVANDEYGDPKLRRLRAPARDAEELARVLADPAIGGFEVDVCHNEPEYRVRRRLSEFFANRTRDDLLLVHFSCHGLKDDDGNLYFATPDTEIEHLDSSSVPSEFVNRQMRKSRSRRIALFLDCCYSGAFSRGGVARAGGGVELAERFDGQGQVVITASNAMEYAFEGDELTGQGTPSVFTTAIVEGLESGAADRDGDDLISIDELYDYIYDRVRDKTPDQTPSKWAYDLQGELYIAKNPKPRPVEPAELPIDLRHAMENPLARVRFGAVAELEHLAGGSNARLAAAARLALASLVDDDSRSVSVAAAAALGDRGEPVAVPAAIPRPVEPRRAAPADQLEPARRLAPPVTQQQPQPTASLQHSPRLDERRRAMLPSWLPVRHGVALVALLGAAFLMEAEGPWIGSDDYQELASGAYRIGVPLGMLLAAAIIDRLPFLTSLGGGLLLALGAVELSWAIADRHGISIVGALVVLAAAVVALVVLADTRADGTEAPAWRGRRRLMVAAPASVGAGLCIAALFVNIPEVYNLHSGSSERMIDTIRGFVGLPVAVAGAVAAAALIALGRPARPLLLAGVLIAVGVDVFLFFTAFFGGGGSGIYFGLVGGAAIAASGVLGYFTSRSRPPQAA